MVAGCRLLLPPIKGTITRRCIEQGRIVYDFVDEFGNPRWCYADQIIEPAE